MAALSKATVRELREWKLVRDYRARFGDTLIELNHRSSSVD